MLMALQHDQVSKERIASDGGSLEINKVIEDSIADKMRPAIRSCHRAD